MKKNLRLQDEHKEIKSTVSPCGWARVIVCHRHQALLYPCLTRQSKHTTTCGKPVCQGHKKRAYAYTYIYTYMLIPHRDLNISQGDKPRCVIQSVTTSSRLAPHPKHHTGCKLPPKNRHQLHVSNAMFKIFYTRVIKRGGGGGPDGRTGLASQINPDSGRKRGSRLKVES